MLSEIETHAAGTPDESFLIHLPLLFILFDVKRTCALCPYIVNNGARCKVQCEGSLKSYTLVRKKYWTPEVDAKFLKLRLQGEV